MIFLVAYDVPDDGVRGRLADTIGAFGERVQESVFECRLDDRGLTELVERIRDTVAPDEGAGVRIYRVCEACYRESVGIGVLRKPLHSDPFLIL